jgi:integrase
MAVRKIRAGGRWRWQARVAFQGARTSRLCGSKQEAKDAEAELLGQLKQRAGQAEAEGARPATLRLLCEAYCEDLQGRGKGKDTVGRAVTTAKALEAILPELMDRPLGEIKPAHVFAFRQGRIRAGCERSTVNRDLRTLRAMLNKARPEFRFPGGAFFPEDETRVRWLRPEEEVIAFATVPAEVWPGKRRGKATSKPGRPVPFRDIARLAALTLMRLGEIVRLRREQVRLEQGVVALPVAKGGSRHVILSREAQEILRARLDAHEREWVFPAPHGGHYSTVHVSRVWRKAGEAAGLADFHFHDLRHHGATRAMNAGFTPPVVMALGGWKTPKMMLRYAAITDKTLRAAAEAVAAGEIVHQSRQAEEVGVTRKSL